MKGRKEERKEERNERKSRRFKKEGKDAGRVGCFPFPFSGFPFLAGFSFPDWGFQFLSPVFSVPASPTFPVYMFGSRLLLRFVITASHGVRCGCHVLGILGWHPQRQPQQRLPPNPPPALLDF